MARPVAGDKPKELRLATLAEVAAVGSTAVSVNRIAARAGLSVGTIYRYYKTKDELLFAVYLEVKRDIHRTMMDAAAPHDGAASRLRAMWFALVGYGFDAPQDFLLAEMMNAETRNDVHDNKELNRIHTEVLLEIQKGVDEGVLVAYPVETIETVLASPAITLARHASMSKKPADREALERIFTLVWRGIARDPERCS